MTKKCLLTTVNLYFLVNVCTPADFSQILFSLYLEDNLLGSQLDCFLTSGHVIETYTKRQSLYDVIRHIGGLQPGVQNEHTTANFTVGGNN